MLINIDWVREQGVEVIAPREHLWRKTNWDTLKSVNIMYGYGAGANIKIDIGGFQELKNLDLVKI